MANYTDILPKVAQWKSIPYVKDFRCPSCDKCSIGGNDAKPSLVGWCETYNGFMLVFECSVCFKKFRCHCSTEIFDKKSLELTIDNYVNDGVPNIIKNAAELNKEMEEFSLWES